MRVKMQVSMIQNAAAVAGIEAAQQKAQPDIKARDVRQGNVDPAAVLHAFQKKSTQGIKTPQHEVELIENRLKRLKELLG